MIEVYIIHNDNGSKVYFEDAPGGIYRKTVTKCYHFDEMNGAYIYLISSEFRENNYYQLFKMNACIKLLVYDSDCRSKLEEVIIYDSYSDFCMHRKSKHQVINPSNNKLEFISVSKQI